MKITKSELLRRLEALEEFASYADNMLTELNHALPDPEYDAKCEAQEADIDASLDEHRERLGLNKPKVGDVYVVVDSKPNANDVKVGCKHTVVAMNGEGDVIFNSSYIAHQTKDGKLEIYGLGVVLEKFVEPKLKQLDQSVFDGLDEKWRFAAVDSKGGAFLFSEKPTFSKSCVGFWFSAGAFGRRSVGYGYNTTDWQNSLIERGKVELTGSDLCRAMLERGDRFILCSVSDQSDNDAIDNLEVQVVITVNSLFVTQSDGWRYAAPVNNQGEPLTAADVDL